MTDATTIRVEGDQPYDVVVGYHLLEHRGCWGTASEGARDHPGVLAASAEGVKTDLTTAGYEVFLAEVPDAEDAKTAEGGPAFRRARRTSRAAAAPVVGSVGSGHGPRGVRGLDLAAWGAGGARGDQHLGHADAAVGGKTGINTDEGKNLVGTSTCLPACCATSPHWRACPCI